MTTKTGGNHSHAPPAQRLAYGLVRLDDGSFREIINTRYDEYTLAQQNPWFEPEDAAVTLRNGDTRRNLMGRPGTEALYKLVVPATVSNLKITTEGGTGDVSLYASLGKAPSVDDAQYWSKNPGSNAEEINIAPAGAGTYYIKVVGEQAYRGVNIQASYTQ